MKATRPAIRQNVSRRSILGLLGFGAATAALTPTFVKTARAQNQTQTQPQTQPQPSPPASTQPSPIITKEIPLSQAQSQVPYWTKAAPPTVARQELYPAVLNGKIYVVGGLLSPNTGFSAHFESYDPGQNAWTALRPIPEARHHITLSAVNGLLYGVGGFTGGFPDWRAQPTMFIDNPAANTWSKGADLPVARAEGIAAVVDNKIYLVGGRVRATEDARLFNDHIDSVRNEVFDPMTKRWSTRADTPTARNSAAAAVIDGKIYVVGGRKFSKNADGTARQVNVPNLEVYDPKLDRWETRSPMPQAQGGLAATRTQRQALLVWRRTVGSRAAGFRRKLGIRPANRRVGGITALANATTWIGSIHNWQPHLCVWWRHSNRRRSRNSDPRSTGIAHLECYALRSLANSLNH